MVSVQTTMNINFLLSRTLSVIINTLSQQHTIVMSDKIDKITLSYCVQDISSKKDTCIHIHK